MNVTLSLEDHQQILQLVSYGFTTKQIANELKLPTHVVQQYSRIPIEDRVIISKNSPVDLSEPQLTRCQPFKIDKVGWWLILCDVHIPHHDKKTLQLAVKTAKKYKISGIILNGDILDHHDLSDYDRDPRAERYIYEVERGQEFLHWVRQNFPRIPIIYKEGNHEERLIRYINRQADVFFGIVDLPKLLDFNRFRVTWITDRRVIYLGKLNVVHGHEFKSGLNCVYPARSLYQKTNDFSICGHWHRSSQYVTKNIRSEIQTAWTVGCASTLYPQYLPLNTWNHGFALVNVQRDGRISVQNFYLQDGKVIC
jgi:predicted phosphodiesterase